MTTAQVVETSVTVNNSLIQDYLHPDDHTQPTKWNDSWIRTFHSPYFHFVQLKKQSEKKRKKTAPTVILFSSVRM